MNKKQRNRKRIQHTFKNRLSNRFYTSKLKTLSLSFRRLLKSNENSGEIDVRKKLSLLFSDIFSVIDKSVKKKIFHKNTAARKKRLISKLYTDPA